MSKIVSVIAIFALCAVFIEIESRPETRGILDTKCNNGFRNAASAAVGTVGLMPAGCFTGAYTRCQQFWSAYYAVPPPNPVPAPVMAPECITSFWTLG